MFQLLLGRIISYLIHSFDLMSCRFSYIFYFCWISTFVWLSCSNLKRVGVSLAWHCVNLFFLYCNFISYSATCLNRTLFGLKDLFGLCRYSVYTGSKCIETDMNGLQKMSGLDRFPVCSGFGLYRFHCMYLYSFIETFTKIENIPKVLSCTCFNCYFSIWSDYLPSTNFLYLVDEYIIFM